MNQQTVFFHNKLGGRGGGGDSAYQWKNRGYAPEIETICLTKAIQSVQNIFSFPNQTLRRVIEMFNLFRSHSTNYANIIRITPSPSLLVHK